VTNCSQSPYQSLISHCFGVGIGKPCSFWALSFTGVRDLMGSNYEIANVKMGMPTWSRVNIYMGKHRRVCGVSHIETGFFACLSQSGITD
jgi:hypothetical protein